MPVSTLTLVILRLFSISWFIQALISVVEVSTMFVMPEPGRIGYWNYALPLFMFALACASWFAGPLLSRLITRRYDTTLAIAGLSLEDLYTLAFVFLGLYFVLNSIAPSLNWVYHFFAIGSLPNPVADQRRSVYQLSSFADHPCCWVSRHAPRQAVGSPACSASRDQEDLTNRWRQPLAAVLSRSDFMREFLMFAMHAAASGASALSR